MNRPSNLGQKNVSYRWYLAAFVLLAILLVTILASLGTIEGYLSSLGQSLVSDAPAHETTQYLDWPSPTVKTLEGNSLGARWVVVQYLPPVGAAFSQVYPTDDGQGSRLQAGNPTTGMLFIQSTCHFSEHTLTSNTLSLRMEEATLCVVNLRYTPPEKK